MKRFELGITTFGEVMKDPLSGETPTYDERINRIIDEIILAENVGLDYFGIGEHHREDFAVSSPQMILAAAAKLTSTIRLGSAVTVLSSEDPVRIYQQFATLKGILAAAAGLVVSTAFTFLVAMDFNISSGIIMGFTVGLLSLKKVPIPWIVMGVIVIGFMTL